MKKGYRYRIYPNSEQQVLLARTFGCCRFIYNRLLDTSIKQYEEYKADNTKPKPQVSGYDFCKVITHLKRDPELAFLKEVSITPLQQSAINLGKAFSGLFTKRGGYPKFKSKHGKQSFSLTSSYFRLKDTKLIIAKSKEPIPVGWGRNGKVRTLPSKPTSCTISLTPTGKYYVSFVCEFTPEKGTGTGTIGIDLGIKDLLVTSDGVVINNPKHFKLHEKNLGKKQQKLSRCKRGSNRYQKARRKVANIHEVIANVRNDFQHKLSRQLVNENQVIGIENLVVKNMVKNRKLSKAISDVAWSSLVYKIIYKAQWSQHTIVGRVDTFFPSTHICNETGRLLSRKLKLSERFWKCPHCGNVHHRDVNAAKNIRDAVTKQLAMKSYPGGTLVLLARD